MAQEEIKFTVGDNQDPAHPNDGIALDLTVTYDPSVKNPDGSFTATSASGTYSTLTPSGQISHVDTITGLVQPSAGLIVDNELFIASNPTTMPIVTDEGIAFSISNTADSANGSGIITLNDQNSNSFKPSPPTDTPNYGLVNSESGNAAMNISETPVCFVTGTRLRTTRGDVPVERLAGGDIAVTANGEERPIVWIGHREMACAGKPEMWPVRVAAEAFGADLPVRDLFLSPGHPVLVGADDEGRGGHLVPIMCLVNGITIVRVPIETVTYWHVELDTHDILLAEDLPAESYLDWGDRGFFSEGTDHALGNPDFAVPGVAGRCRPVAIDGPVVEAERRRIDAFFATRAETACAWPQTMDAFAFLS